MNLDREIMFFREVLQMKFRVLIVCAAAGFALVMSFHHAAGKSPSELMAISEFAGADPEARLAWVNAKLDAKEYTSSDINTDLMTRLIMDVLVQEASVKDQMTRYGKIRETYGKLVATYDLEKYLATQYLATVPEAMNADVRGKCKIIHQLQKQNVLSWPGIADVLKGMIAFHLATSEEYQAMTPIQKIEYLAGLDGLNVVSNLTSSSFTKGIAAELMSGTPTGQQADVAKQIDASADFFTRSSIQKGYLE